MNAQILQWNELNLVLAICRAGTLSGAARALGVNHSTVFRRIGAIEEQLGVRLFDRLPNGYAMTEAGEAVRAASERIENEVFELSRQLVGRDLSLNGTLRVTAPDALALKVLMPHISSFCQAYPRVQLDLSVENRFLDLAQRQADVAIRATSSPPESMLGHRLCKLTTTVYGSKDRLRDSGDDLQNTAWLMPGIGLDWFSANTWLSKTYPSASVVFRSDTLLALFEAARLSLGLAPLPCFIADPESTLKRVIDPPDALASEIWLLIHPDLRRTARVRAFVDHVRESLADDKDLIEGNRYL